MSPEQETDEITTVEAIAFGSIVALVLSVPIVGVGMYWLLDTPVWTLAVATCIIFAGSIALFLHDFPDDEEEDEGRDFRWVRVRPSGLKDWAKYIGNVMIGWIGLNFLIGFLLVEQLLGGSVTARAITSLVCLIAAIALESFDSVPVDDEPAPPDFAPLRSGSNTRYHSRNQT